MEEMPSAKPEKVNKYGTIFRYLTELDILAEMLQTCDF